ncbi:MAG: phospholipase D family protein [Verrucomicrobia bacterium]|nr:phospholipase D family protein [Verrucomicrobiota bacterium]
MKHCLSSLLIAWLIPAFASTVTANDSAASGTVSRKNAQAYFSPSGGCTEAILKALHAAKSTIRVQAYKFTSSQIAKALVDAKQRGVNVQMILDQSQRSEGENLARFVAHAGVPTYIDDKHATAHNKTMVIDGRILITGSFNFTKAAEKENAENLLVIEDADLATCYSRNWEAHRQHSTLFTGE